MVRNPEANAAIHESLESKPRGADVDGRDFKSKEARNDMRGCKLSKIWSCKKTCTADTACKLDGARAMYKTYKTGMRTMSHERTAGETYATGALLDTPW